MHPGLFAELHGRVASGTVCYPRSARAAAPKAWRGVELRSPVLYDTFARTYDPTIVGRVDVVAVASPSAVQVVGPVKLPFASIGRVTSAAIRRLGCEVWAEADPPSFEALAEAIADQAGPSRHQRA